MKNAFDFSNDSEIFHIKRKDEMLNLDKHTHSIAEICQRLSVKRLEAFGSSLREDFDMKNSDVDLLYEFQGTDNIFIRFISLKRELETLFGRKVDLLRETQINNPYIKQELARTPRKKLYAA